MVRNIKAKQSKEKTRATRSISKIVSRIPHVCEKCGGDFYGARYDLTWATGKGEVCFPCSDNNFNY